MNELDSQKAKIRKYFGYMLVRFEYPYNIGTLSHISQLGLLIKIKLRSGFLWLQLTAVLFLNWIEILDFPVGPGMWRVIDTLR
jgi:hypothetical protein